MSGFTNSEEAIILDDRFDTRSLWVGLSSTTPAEDGTGVTEPSSGSYARVEADGVAGDWNAASGGAPSTKDNAVAFTFPQATADWVSGNDLTHFVVYDASTGGTLVAFGPLDTAKPVLTDDTAELPAGSVTVRLGDPGDTFD